MARPEVVEHADDGRARNFERRRLEAGFTRTDIANEFGVKYESVRRWEKGMHPIPNMAFLALQYLADRE